MKDFETIIIKRKVKITFHHPKDVIAIFQAQSVAQACQGQWKTEMVSIPKNEYSLDKLKKKIEEGFDVDYY